MSVEKVISEWKKNIFKPIYWIEGDEAFQIDQLVNYAEHHILSEGEDSFNLTVFYGKDAEWANVLNACRKYPMFSNRQVVILKEAQQMKEVDKLAAYIQNPLSSTVFVVAYKDKKLDARTSLAKLLKKQTEYILTKKIFESALPQWVNTQVSNMGYSITPKANQLLVDHIGNDLSRIKNEIDKILVNLGSRKKITEDDVENYVGISKDFNVFELQKAIGEKNLINAIRIIQYFGANPKTAPIQMILPTLYAFFSKVYVLCSTSGSDGVLASEIGISSFHLPSYKKAATIYGPQRIEKNLLLLHQYNLKSVGMNAVSGIEDIELLKEMTAKMML